uniref:Uncharacterized protein n=1 Tax=Odontella aurita TaxID=265563 RepID=A0A7S4HYK8_9STRA|mmetsp:Transcript_17159/g.49654  ORF Transcript_17159/g.49654 Transcript_17159/m.49654 type:complete len:120 (+) Transcript_17159:107-466(+)
MLSSSGASLEDIDRRSDSNSNSSPSCPSPARSTTTTTKGPPAGGGGRNAMHYAERARTLLEDRDRGFVRMSARSKFMLMDLVERAENGWESAHGGGAAAAVATTLRQIRKDAMKVRPIR